ncbi:unnamed protein product, partial [Prorocentrum cordatum]
IAKESDCEWHGWAPRASGRVRVFDLMTFMNELEVVEARFHELYEMVEAFVSRRRLGMTHQGSRRNSTFASCRSTPGCHARFGPFLDKVHYTFVGSLPSCGLGEAWSCENAHRELLTEAFVAAGGTDEDVAIVGDADEFPRASTSWALAHCEVPERMNIETDFYYPDTVHFTAYGYPYRFYLFRLLLLRLRLLLLLPRPLRLLLLIVFSRHWLLL